MKNSHIASRVVIAALPALALLMGGCAVDTQGTETTTEAEVGTTSQALSGWSTFSWGTTTDLDGLDTNLPLNTWTCFLSGVAGDLSKGTSFDPKAVKSRSGVGGWLFDTTWHVFGHGGATQDANGNRVWLNNPVNTGATCVPHPRIASATWESTDQQTAAPVKITNLGDARRQCFLTNLSGGFGLWNSANNYARVVRMSTVDATHPTTGWYVESNEQSGGGGGVAKLTASCVDFPTGTTFQSNIVNASGTVAETTTIGAALTGVKACGLAEIRGAFTQNSWTNGVVIKSPSTLNGSWTMTASAGKYGRSTCAR